MRKVIITAAVTGGDVVPSQSPYLPITPQEIADEAVGSAEAGAAVVHVHARDPKTGEPSADPALFEEIMVSIKNRSDAIICPTTGGNSVMSIEERMRILPRFKPEMATMNAGSLNYALHFIARSFERRGKEFKHDWEKPYLEESDKYVFKNTFSDMSYIINLMDEHNIMPEIEIYDLGMLYNVDFLIREGILKKPLQLQFVLGVVGGAGCNTDVLSILKNEADKLLGKDSYNFSTIGAGYPAEFHMGTMSLLLGGNVRVGMEDNFRINKTTLAKNNAELVDKMVKITNALDFDIASPDDAREILNLKGKDKVGF